jgi:hypothetical protein
VCLGVAVEPEVAVAVAVAGVVEAVEVAAIRERQLETIRA